MKNIPKSWIYTALAVFGLSLAAACKQAPVTPSFGKKGSAEGGGKKKKPNGKTPTDGPAPEPGVDPDQVFDYSILNVTCPTPKEQLGLRQWRRLSNRELSNTVQSIFGSVNGVSYDFINDYPRRELYDTLMVPNNHVDSTRMKSYQTFAANLASKIDINKVLPCFKEGAACIPKSFLPLAEKAYRRPLSADESNNYTQLYAALVKDKFNQEKAARFMIEALAQSEPFLYRTELGTANPDGTYTLTHFEVASALSYSFVRRPPDDTLMALARENKLHDLETIRTQAERLIKLNEAREAMAEFGGMWLGSKKITTHPKSDEKWTEPQRKASQKELEDLFADSFFAQGSKLSQLLLAEAIPSQSKTDFPYGAKAADNVVQFPQDARRGVLGTSAFLAANSSDAYGSPVQRGVYVLERLMCVGFEPPPEVPPTPIKPGQTNKDRYRVYEAGPCGACHATINQYGFALENFDGSGVYIEKDAGKPIETDSMLEIDEKEVNVTSADEMSKAIAGSDQYMECFARNIFRYTRGRLELVPHKMVGETTKTFTMSAGTEADRCEIQSVAKAVKTGKGNMQEALITSFVTPSFLNRMEFTSSGK